MRLIFNVIVKKKINFQRFFYINFIRFIFVLDKVVIYWN